MDRNEQWIVYGQEAEGFEEALEVCCRRTLTATVVLRDGTKFGAVLIGVNNQALIYEEWDGDMGMTNGEPGM